jgi:nitrile hydratase
MNGVFDLGGTDGMGPVNPPAEEPLFSAEWEKSVFAMFPLLFRAGYFGLDEFRNGIEQMDPAVYLKSPYYEHWLYTYEHNAVSKGYIDADELERRRQYYLQNPTAPLPQHKAQPELVEFVSSVASAGAPAQRPTDKPAAFAVGDAVRISTDAPFGHSRRARYIRGKVAEVVAHRGSFIYPDSAGNGLGDDPQHVYTVKFTSQELWGDKYADPNGSVLFDVWEPYITAVNATEGATA